MSGDLLFSVGLDATPLDTGVAQVERKLEAAGVKFSEAPRKYANASAKAFEEVFSAEQKLSNYRDEAAHRRLTDEQKVAALQQQSVAILTQAQAIEGQSAEKAKLMLQYEEKKSSIFELNQKIQAKAASDQGAQADAERKLTAYREEAAHRRLTDEQKVAALQQQSVAILTQAQAIEGQSAEKAKLMLQYEEKKSSIFELNQKIQAKAASDQGAQADAERKLTAYREEASFRRLSDEEKLAVLRQQALSILGRAQAIEGQSAEKSGLMLEYEQKKTAIYDLNQKAQAESLAQQKAQTVEVDVQSKKYAGLSGTVELIKKGFKDLGVSIQGAGIGVFVAAVINLGKQAINQAQEQRDLYERMRQPLDANTASLARFGDGLDAVKKGAVTSVGFIVSGYTLIGETIGSVINRMRGISAAQEKINEEGAREADYQQARAQRLKQEQYDREKIRDLVKEVGEAQKKFNFDNLNDEQQWSALLQKNIDLRIRLRQMILDGKNDTVLFNQLQKEQIESASALRAKDIQLVKQSHEQQLEAITTAGQLAITYQEKQNLLRDQAKVISHELRILEEKGLETEGTRVKLRANAVQQVQLERDHTEKLAFDAERVLEIVRLQFKEKTRGLTEVEAGVLRMYKLQLEERANQLKIEELILVKRKRELTPEEQKSLETLLKQEKVIEKQLKLYQGNLDVAIARNAEEDVTKMTLEQQVAKLQQQGVGYDQIMATLTGRGASEVQILAVLDAQKKKIDEQEQALIRVEKLKRQGQEYNEQSSSALEGVVARLKSQLDAIRQKNASLPVNQRDPFQNALEAEYRNAVNELSLRRAIGGYASANGEDAARFRYGDTDTDRALRSMQDEATKQRVTIEQLLAAFNKSIASTPK